MSPFDPFLLSLGWNAFFQKSLGEYGDEKTKIGRLIGQARGHYLLQVTSEFVLEAVLSSKDRHKASVAADFPAVGDWVTYSLEEGSEQAQILQVLNRKNSIQRRRPGSKHDVQLMAANVDYMLIVSSLNEDFNLDRLGRYIELAEKSAVTPVLLLTKADLCPSYEKYVGSFKARFENVEVFLLSNQDVQSIDQLQKFFALGMTSILLGSSGVGKSTLANYLLGAESLKTGSVTSESRGRHTTTSRNLLVTRWGGLVIDTPGMQGIANLGQEDARKKDFSEIESVILQCKFTNCQHKSEPSCAVKGALKNGSLSEERWNEYLEATVGSQQRKNRR